MAKLSKRVQALKAQVDDAGAARDGIPDAIGHGLLAFAEGAEQAECIEVAGSGGTVHQSLSSRFSARIR